MLFPHDVNTVAWVEGNTLNMIDPTGAILELPNRWNKCAPQQQIGRDCSCYNDTIADVPIPYGGQVRYVTARQACEFGGFVNYPECGFQQFPPIENDYFRDVECDNVFYYLTSGDQIDTMMLQFTPDDIIVSKILECSQQYSYLSYLPCNAITAEDSFLVIEERIMAIAPLAVACEDSKPPQCSDPFLATITTSLDIASLYTTAAQMAEGVGQTLPLHSDDFQYLIARYGNRVGFIAIAWALLQVDFDLENPVDELSALVTAAGPISSGVVERLPTRILTQFPWLPRLVQRASLGLAIVDILLTADCAG